MNKRLTECKIRVEIFPLTGPNGDPGYEWECTCSATGNLQDTHQMALNFGIEHLKIMSERVRENEANISR